jgi:2'-5' RNA ligase
VIIPPKNVWEPIQQIRRKHDDKIDRWMPHINLFYPFAPKWGYEKYVKNFRRRCRKFQAFPITLKSFKYFRHRYQRFTMWLHPEPNNLIIHLQRELLKLAPEFNDLNRFKGGFQPHLSVGQFTTYKIHETIAQFQDTWTPLKFMLDKIYFISRANTKNKAFQVVEKIELKHS